MKFVNRNPKIYVLSGKAESGKSYVARRIKSILNGKGIRSIDIAYASYLKEYAKNISNWDGSEDTKPRDLLQQLGVDLIKNTIDSNFLINRVVEDIRVYSYFFDAIIVTDARFVEEIEVIRDNFFNVVVLRIVGGDNSLTNDQKNHITETALDEYNNYDFVINNGSDLEMDLMEVLK